MRDATCIRALPTFNVIMIAFKGSAYLCLYRLPRLHESHWAFCSPKVHHKNPTRNLQPPAIRTPEPGRARCCGCGLCWSVLSVPTHVVCTCTYVCTNLCTEQIRKYIHTTPMYDREEKKRTTKIKRSQISTMASTPQPTSTEPLKDEDDEVTKLKIAIQREKAAKRKMYGYLVKIADELKTLRNESEQLINAAEYARRAWYEGGMWRGVRASYLD